MQVELQPSEGTSPPLATIYCDKTANIGPVPVPLRRLNRWSVTEGAFASAVAHLLGSSSAPVSGTQRGSWDISLGRRKNEQQTLVLSLDKVATIASSSQVVPIVEVLELAGNCLAADGRAVRRLLQSDGGQPRTGVGSKKWRSENARKAANARHGQPGGNRDKTKRLLDAWKSGKYPSRNKCAERESRRIGISVTTARKALQNVPDPRSRP